MIRQLNTRSVFAVLLLSFAFLAGCENKVIPPSDAGYKKRGTSDTNYVEINPPWTGYESPQAIIIGRDQLIYVADYDGNMIYMLDASGAVLASRSIPHPTCIAQNFKLDLYVGGETYSAESGHTIGAIYKINLVRWDTTYLAGFRIDTLRSDTIPIYRDTSYFFDHALKTAHASIVWQEPAEITRRFTGIGILPGNQYLVARVGDDNTSFVDPDTRVLLFESTDILQQPVTSLVTRASGGTAITDIRNLTGLMVIPSSRDFIVTQSHEQVSYGAIWMVYKNTPDFTGWQPNFDPSVPAQQNINFIKVQYLHPAAATYDTKRKEVFIVDAGLDSVLKFSRTGVFKNESFGKYKTSLTADTSTGLRHPMGIAYSSDCTIYVTDTGHKMIRRFKLSTQINTCY